MENAEKQHAVKSKVLLLVVAKVVLDIVWYTQTYKNNSVSSAPWADK